MEKKMYAFTSLMAGFMSLILFSSFYNTEPDTSFVGPLLPEPEYTFPQHVAAIDLNREFSFAGEKIPAGNFDALERLDRELVVNTYLQSLTLLNIKTANRYFPVIEPILERYGIPNDFKYLSVAESNLRMATSSAGAKGIWQFMEAAGEAYGLEIHGEVDERYHVEKSTEAACKFLLHLHKKFGSWTLAAAAYNMGETGLARRLREQQAQNYYDLNLNEETSRYVFRIIAIKEIMQNPKAFGFVIEDDQLYQPLTDYYAIIVDGPVQNLASLAVQHGTTYRMLKIFNPWLMASSLTNRSGKKYEIRFPKKS
jgi:hypothetical protein